MARKILHPLRKNMKIEGEKKYIIMCAALIAANVLLIGGAVLIAGSILKNSEILGGAVVKLDKKRLSTENLRDNLNLIKETDQKVASYDRLFFTQGQELQLITDLENIAAKNNVSQKITSPNLDNYANNRVTITVSATGPYINTLKFMSDLEKYRYLMAIEQINFQPSGYAAGPNGANEFITTMQITLSLYAQPSQ